jgi:hypothetical protein
LAAHVVAGATFEALKAGANIGMLFNNMIDYLNTMNQYDSIWATGMLPAPTPAPTPTPVPPPAPPQDECACLCQCFQLCKAKNSPVVHGPRLSTQPSEMAVSE